jgi:lipoic acid synthetase
MKTMGKRATFPNWLKKTLPTDGAAAETARLLQRLGLATICQSAKCPNIYECFSRRIATILILGRQCTRKCRFCAVGDGMPAAVDEDEPRRVAEAIRELGLRHAVITSVTRDDLPDGGAEHYARVVTQILSVNDRTTVEVLTPDFAGRTDVLRQIVEAGPVIFGHNVETAPRLYAQVRPGADYKRSLRFLEAVRELATPGLLTKSGLMVGLGETFNEVLDVFRDLRSVRCDIVTVGQYLQPTAQSLPVNEFVAPETFQDLEQKALAMGFRGAFCGPFVRSSYLADRFVA